ncbi:hypothetical protein J6590_060677 [Homalodisca vitripennis]|nr:hypothetical protein J6590_060677 [Homalodisca vitripennis]
MTVALESRGGLWGCASPSEESTPYNFIRWLSRSLCSNFSETWDPDCFRPIHSSETADTHSYNLRGLNNRDLLYCRLSKTRDCFPVLLQQAVSSKELELVRGRGVKGFAYWRLRWSQMEPDTSHVTRLSTPHD